MSKDKPEIRLHRYEYLPAVKRPAFGHWLMIRPGPGPESGPPGEPAAPTE